MASLTPAATPASIDTPDIGKAGRELLSLALMDARNHTLHLLAQYEQALGEANFAVPRSAELSPPLWLAGHIGWFSEFWIGRNPTSGSRLPYLLRVPVSGEGRIFLAARDT